MSKFSTVCFQNVVLIIFDFVAENVPCTTFIKPFYPLREKRNVNSFLSARIWDLIYSFDMILFD